MSEQVIIHSQANGIVAVTHVADPASIEALAQNPDIVPSGEAYEIVDNSTLPSDETFRNAWQWSGVGTPIYEDLEKSRTIALNAVRSVALSAAARAEESEQLFETPAQSSSSIRGAYVECKTMLTNASTVEELKSCMTSFESTYAVPL